MSSRAFVTPVELADAVGELATALARVEGRLDDQRDRDRAAVDERLAELERLVSSLRGDLDSLEGDIVTLDTAIAGLGGAA